MERLHPATGTPGSHRPGGIGRTCIRAAQLTVIASTVLLTGTAAMAGIDRDPLVKRPLATAVAGYVQHQGARPVLNRNGRYLTAPSRKPAEAIVMDYIQRNPAPFALAPNDIATLYVAKEYVSPRNGAQYLTLGQRIDGIRVHGAAITAGLDREGRLVLIGGRTGSRNARGRALISAADAIARAAQLEGLPRRTLPAGADTRATGVHRFDNVYARGLQQPNPVTAELVWFINADRSLRLAWLTDVEIDGQTWNETLIDATTGAALTRESRYAHVGGRVFTGQHPDDSPARQLVNWPAEWVTVVPGATVTSGNNVNAYQDRANTNTVGYRPTSPDDSIFDFNFADAWRALPDGTDFVDIVEATWNAAINTDRDYTLTQLFHYTNDMHDWLYGYGFDEASGNFQVDNFGLGGAGNDPVRAEAHDGIDFGCAGGARCSNNANFATPVDGGSPRMQMYLWIRPNRPYRDGSLDGDVIAHEYGHGVSNRLVPGALSNATNQAGSLGEGWSDTVSLLRWGDTTVGEYVTGNANSGIRNSAYDVHPWTYGDYSTSVGSPHRNGEIWAAAMYLIRTRLGIPATAQLVLDGMRLTVNGPSPTFLNARDGILAADLLDGGNNFCALSASFAQRGMGVDAVSNGLHAVPTEDFDASPACLPSADAGGPYNTVEGTDVMLSAASSGKGSHASAGAPVSYEWDLDNDGQYDDATGVSANFSLVGNDGVHTVGVRVTDAFGLVSTDTSTVTVANVAPTVNINAISPVDEHGFVTISGSISDPGWLEPLTATIDYDDGSGTHALGGTLENVRPNAVLSFSVQRQYGDNGNFEVTVCGRDTVGGAANPATVCSSRTARIDNRLPTMAIQTGGTESYAGKQAFVLEQGESLDVPGSASDPGSDDLTFTWDWDDGSADDSQTSLVNPPVPDPAKSPSIQPRDVTLQQAHVFQQACLYQLGLSVADDDGGVSSDTVAVVVTGNADLSKGSGWWLNQYRTKAPNDFSPAQLQCYLDIVTYFSTVFTAPMTRSQATQLLNAPSKAPALTVFKEQLLAAWLNFANGAVKFDTPVDTDGVGGVDTTFGAAILQAETVANNPASTDAQIRAQKAIVERIVQRDN